MTTVFTKIKKAILAPLSVVLVIKNKLIHLFRLHILKDEFSSAIAKWLKDKGDETLRHNYPLSVDSIVFDLGGYKGDFAAAIHDKYNCNVYVFEPVNLFYLECVKRFHGNEKIKCFNYGLSCDNGSVSISNEDNGSSFIKNNTSQHCERVNIKSIEEEMTALNIQHIDLLKINVEGAEFLILPHLILKNLISKIDYLQIQFHTFYPSAVSLRNAIREDLSKTHIEQWNYPFVWESWARKR